MQCSSLRDSDPDITEYGVAHFMVSADTPEVNKKFAENHKAKFPILSDPSKEMPKAYGALMPAGYCFRWTFYIDKEGIIQKIDKKVKVKTAGADTLASIKELGWAE